MLGEGCVGVEAQSSWAAACVITSTVSHSTQVGQSDFWPSLQMHNSYHVTEVQEMKIMTVGEGPPHQVTRADCSLYVDTQLSPFVLYSRSRTAAATCSLWTSVSWRVATWRSFTTPLASSDSPKMAARGMPISSQYCSCASNLGFCLYECSAWNDKDNELWTQSWLRFEVLY